LGTWKKQVWLISRAFYLKKKKLTHIMPWLMRFIYCLDEYLSIHDKKQKFGTWPVAKNYTHPCATFQYLYEENSVNTKLLRKKILLKTTHACVRKCSIPPQWFHVSIHETSFSFYFFKSLGLGVRVDVSVVLLTVSIRLRIRVYLLEVLRLSLVRFYQA